MSNHRSDLTTNFHCLKTLVEVSSCGVHAIYLKQFLQAAGEVSFIHIVSRNDLPRKSEVSTPNDGPFLSMPPLRSPRFLTNEIVYPSKDLLRCKCIRKHIMTEWKLFSKQYEWNHWNDVPIAVPDQQSTRSKD